MFPELKIIARISADLWKWAIFTILKRIEARDTGVMDTSRCRKLGSVWAIVQGTLSAVAPQLSIAMTRKMLGMSFENAESLEAKPGYVRQIRALGIGLAAAGIAGLAMEKVSEDQSPEEIEEPSDDDSL